MRRGKQIKVMHVIQELNVGGAERVVANYVKNHDRAMFTPQVCAISEGGAVADEIEACGVKVTVLGKRPGLDLSVIGRFRKLVADEGVKILHLHNPPANNWGVPASLLNHGVVTVRTEHNVFYKGRIVRGYPVINMALGMFNSKIITVSEQVKKSHLAKDFLNRKKYVTVYNGIEGGIYKKHYDTDRIRHELAIPSGSPVIGKIASLSRQKAYPVFLMCAAAVLKKRPDAVFLAIGGGKLKQELESARDAMGLGGKVIFTGIRHDIPMLLQLMDIFMLSSDWEGLPMTVLEAMASSRPCVVTDVGGNREAVIDGETGIITPPGDPDALATAVLGLLENKKLMKRMGEKGRERFENNFTVESMVAKTESIYLRALGIQPT